MIEIPLTQGFVALVDDRDGWVADWSWYVWHGASTHYAQRRGPVALRV